VELDLFTDVEGRKALGDLLTNAHSLFLVEAVEDGSNCTGGTCEEVPGVVCVAEAPRESDLLDVQLREAGLLDQLTQAVGAQSVTHELGHTACMTG
jgi:hypothetical protein